MNKLSIKWQKTMDAFSQKMSYKLDVFFLSDIIYYFLVLTVNYIASLRVLN